MKPLTRRQSEVLEFVTDEQARGMSVSVREVAEHFGFRSMNAALKHLQALRDKGALARQPGKARSLRVVSSRPPVPLAEIPIYGSIPAGLAEHRVQEAEKTLSVSLETLGLSSSKNIYGLAVRGESMTGAGIFPGDIVFVDAEAEPQPGDVVAALIDGESTLKTFSLYQGTPVLQAENPRYPDLFPVEELTVQGVVVASLRRFQRSKTQ